MSTRQLRREQLRRRPTRLRESTEQLLDNDHRAQRDSGRSSPGSRRSRLLIDVRSYLQDIDSRAAVAHTIASGAADAIDSVTLETVEGATELGSVHDHVVQLSEAACGFASDADKAVFVYDELTSRPYIDEDHPLVD